MLALVGVLTAGSASTSIASGKSAQHLRSALMNAIDTSADIWASNEVIQFDPRLAPQSNGAPAPVPFLMQPEIPRPPPLFVPALPPPAGTVPAPRVAQEPPVASAKSPHWPGVTHGSWWPEEDPNSCNGFFGNGWNTKFSLLPQGAGAPFNCSYHPGLTTHVCETRMLGIDATKMQMVQGGEKQEHAKHREENDEIPVFHSGAFTLKVTDGRKRLDEYPGQYKRFTTDLNLNMYRSFELSSADVTCTNFISGTTVFVVRFEYHNLFHTSTDWYDVYQAARSFAGSERVNVVFLDGHAKSAMDEVWEAWVANVWYVKALPQGTCFERALFVPYGWHAAINPVANLPGKQCPGNERVREFSDSIVRSFGLTPGASGKCTKEDTTILMVRRVNYKRRPQHDGNLETRLGHEDQIMTSLTAWAAGRPGTRILEGNFHIMSMKEQMQQAQQACLFIGAHGAGMSHILFARPGTSMLEIRTPQYMRPHFQVQSMWIGAKYVTYDVGGMNADTNRVLDYVQQLVG